MKLNKIVPWGRNFSEYTKMFLLSDEDLKLKILSCGDGPASFNFELNKKYNGNVVSIDPIYQFGPNEIENRIKITTPIIEKELTNNKEQFTWKDFQDVKALIKVRLSAMKLFLSDFENGKLEQRYINAKLPNLPFADNSFDLVISSHFLFLYSPKLDFNFHKTSILEMCRVAKKEVRIFPLLNLENIYPEYLSDLIQVLEKKKFKTQIVNTKYEFQKGAFEMLKIECNKEING